MSLPSTLSSQQVVADPSGGGGGAPGSAGAGGAGLAPADSLAGKAVFEMKIAFLLHRPLQCLLKDQFGKNVYKLCADARIDHWTFTTKSK